MDVDQQVIDLATGIQCRHDFTAHLTGFAAGTVVICSLNLAGVRGASLYTATLLTWAAALSLQHFRHVLRGPVTADAVGAEAARRSRRSGRPDHPNPRGDQPSTVWPTDMCRARAR